ncbi:hypothetical protein FHS42_003680 [Streptomyces zagrosensis]|uniref:SUKH-4 immunity protein n=2 Tax=Streptomyces zagrosensis TaxID=1042984 RepID=A0A7W9QAI1_9ACTN|nr:hypothetical protein [Streptomyces zagrosensis]
MRTFGDRDVLCISAAAAADQIIDENTRSTMYELGIPGQLGNALVVSSSIPHEGLVTLSEHYPYGGSPVASRSTGDYLWLASAVGGDVCLDGTTGGVFFVKPDYEPPVSRINTSLERFVECMFVIEREVLSEEVPNDPESYARLLNEIIGLTSATDSEAFPGDAMFWQQVIDSYLQELAG